SCSKVDPFRREIAAALLHHRVLPRRRTPWKRRPAGARCFRLRARSPATRRRAFGISSLMYCVRAQASERERVCLARTLEASRAAVGGAVRLRGPRHGEAGRDSWPARNGFLAPLQRLERATRCLEDEPEGGTARH